MSERTMLNGGRPTRRGFLQRLAALCTLLGLPALGAAAPRSRPPGREAAFYRRRDPR